MCKGIKKGVGCCVVALSRIAEDRGDGRKHDETIECHVARAFMKQPGTERFRAKDARHSLTVESSQRRIVNEHGEMEHATQRLAVLLNDDAPLAALNRERMASVLGPKAL